MSDENPVAPKAGLFGRVVFVGLGAGNPALLTVAGLRALADAALIITCLPTPLDIQAWPELRTAVTGQIVRLEELADDQDRAQQAALDLAIQQCRQGHTVAWVSDGDPVVDGKVVRLAGACRAHGCRIELLPGVCLVTAISDLAGVDLSHGATMQAFNPHAPAVSGSGTAIVQVADGDLAGFVAASLAAGRSAEDSVLALWHPASLAQRSTLTMLGALAQAQAADDGPVVVVLGEAARRDEALNWFETRPLYGWRVLLPRTRGRAGALEHRLAVHGASLQIVDTMAIEPPRNTAPMERAVHGLVEGAYQWVVFTDVNAVRAVLDRFEVYGLDARSFSGIRIAACDLDAVDALEAWGIRPDLVATQPTAAALAAEFPSYDDLLDPLDGVLVPRAGVATDDLNDALVRLGWQVEDVMVFRAVRAAPPPQQVREAIKAGDFDAVVFTSSSTVRNMVGIAGKPHADTIVAAIGPKTAQTCAEHGLRVDVVAPIPDHVHLVDALAGFAEARRATQIANNEPLVRPSQRRRRRSRRASQS